MIYTSKTSVEDFNPTRHLRFECDAAERRQQYSGKQELVKLPAFVTVPGEVRKGKSRYGTIEAVRQWLKENAK